MWLVENGFDRFVNRFKEEEIDGLSLLHLSSSSIEDLLSTKIENNIVKRPTIICALFYFSTVVSLDEKQSDLFLQQLQSNESNHLLFLNDFNIDNEQLQLQVSSSISSTSNQSPGQPSININSLQLTGASPNQMIDEQPSNNSLINSTLSQSRKQFSLNYILPIFDKAFEQAAEDPSSSEFGARCKRKQQLVKTIRDDIVNTYGIDFYPTSYEFDRMIVCVKNKFPALGKIFGEDMSLLTSALKQQCSRDRQVSSCLSEVLLKKRQSYGHQMAGRKLKFVKEYLLEEKQQPEELLMQLYQQAESMRVLINTTNYDYGQVKSKMDITYAHRQNLIREMKPIKEIIELYPALSITDLLIREINLHFDPFDGDIVQILKLSCTKLFKKEQPLFILEHLIMKRYKHSKKLLLSHEVIDAYPIIQIQTAKNIKNYSIVIEYNTIITTNSQAEAISILIGSYEIFNIEYPTKVRATLEVLNGLSFKKRSFSLSLAAKRFLNEHKLNKRAL
ncbi:unnamed protein product [Rotaria magnacalcarata]|uniref:SAM domain-containing protein n=2 Tax=Rotaria magnacalcarata TaxID=392030 RepID=A0A8S2N2U4_9BILA|nr:unnamed protein product [Rotaria magnacalcarata]CAF4183362.1 unnamed protein product [Rotaria magnacalcarata]